MKNILIALSISLATLTSAIATTYDCSEENVMTYTTNNKSVNIYNFGGASNDCNRIALKLNLFVIQNGPAKFFDCDYPAYPYVTIKSDLGDVLTMVKGNFNCEKLALSLNRAL